MIALADVAFGITVVLLLAILNFVILWLMYQDFRATRRHEPPATHVVSPVMPPAEAAGETAGPIDEDWLPPESNVLDHAHADELLHLYLHLSCAATLPGAGLSHDDLVRGIRAIEETLGDGQFSSLTTVCSFGETRSRDITTRHGPIRISAKCTPADLRVAASEVPLIQAVIEDNRVLRRGPASLLTAYLARSADLQLLRSQGDAEQARRAFDAIAQLRQSLLLRMPHIWESSAHAEDTLVVAVPASSSETLRAEAIQSDKYGLRLPMVELRCEAPPKFLAWIDTRRERLTRLGVSEEHLEEFQTSESALYQEWSAAVVSTEPVPYRRLAEAWVKAFARMRHQTLQAAVEAGSLGASTVYEWLKVTQDAFSEVGDMDIAQDLASVIPADGSVVARSYWTYETETPENAPGLWLVAPDTRQDGVALMPHAPADPWARVLALVRDAAADSNAGSRADILNRFRAETEHMQSVARGGERSTVLRNVANRYWPTLRDTLRSLPVLFDDPRGDRVATAVGAALNEYHVRLVNLVGDARRWFKPAREPLEYSPALFDSDTREPLIEGLMPTDDKRFAQVESFFHGQQSGRTPVVPPETLNATTAPDELELIDRNEEDLSITFDPPSSRPASFDDATTMSEQASDPPASEATRCLQLVTAIEDLIHGQACSGDVRDRLEKLRCTIDAGPMDDKVFCKDYVKRLVSTLNSIATEVNVPAQARLDLRDRLAQIVRDRNLEWRWPDPSSPSDFFVSGGQQDMPAILKNGKVILTGMIKKGRG